VNHAPRTASYTRQRRRVPYGPLRPCAGVTAVIRFRYLMATATELCPVKATIMWYEMCGYVDGLVPKKANARLIASMSAGPPASGSVISSRTCSAKLPSAVSPARMLAISWC
jgi:hypothetical protein